MGAWTAKPLSLKATTPIETFSGCFSTNALAAAQAAADRGVRIYTLGLGTPEGAVLDIDGFRVRSRLDEGLLTQIAEISGGAYFRAGDPAALNAVYEDLIPRLQLKEERMEITALLAGLSILIFLAGGALSLAWFNRLP